MLAARDGKAYWEGELSASALSTATAISTLAFYLECQNARIEEYSESLIRDQIRCGLKWLVTQQNEDGGWGDTSKSYSNISTTMLTIAAIHACGAASKLQPILERAESYLEQLGGIPALRARYGKDKTFAVPILANCAMAGIVDWKEVSALPFEAACVPQRFYNLMQLPVVSYAIPALVAIGQAKFHFDPPWDPFRKMIRKASIGPSLKVLERMQPSTGGFLEAVPLTSFVSMALIRSQKTNNPVVRNGIRFILESFRREGDESGSWPIDTNLATWNTTLSINALAQHEGDFADELSENWDQWESTIEWLLSCQNRTRHPFTGAAPGGWGWSDLSGAVPDADDTPGALLALRKIYNVLESNDLGPKKLRVEILRAKEEGLKWLVDLQNRDRGWPTFCRGWGKLPFDRSGTDITAHAIRGLDAWKDSTAVGGIDKAIRHGFRFLRNNQQKDGSWNPLWFGNQDTTDEINPCYGTAKVLMAYRDTSAFDTHEAKIGLNWIRQNQNPDGGWGGGSSLSWAQQELGNSSVEETALCTEILLDHDDESSQLSARRGVEWLRRAVQAECIDRSSPIGFYFAKLWYFESTYPIVFATSALARAKQTQADQQD